MTTELSPGLYRLPPNCKAFVRDGKVIVSLKKKVVDICPRCRDCKHFGYGRATAGGWNQSPICRLRPKTIKSYHRPDPIYYSTLASRKACDKFEQIPDPQEP